MLAALLCVFLQTSTQAGGGMVLEDDACVIWVDFYSAHFTAYQPDSRGNEQFCQELPDTGLTLFVLDYLHQSLKEVPVELRVIRDVTGQGRFVKLQHVEQIEDIDQHTVHHQPPVVRADASLQIEFDLAEEGNYIGIVSAGHPSSDEVYTAVFPFKVGGSNSSLVFMPLLLIGLTLIIILRRRSRLARNQTTEESPL